MCQSGRSPADGNQPENGLTGTLFKAELTSLGTITVPDTDGKMRFWRGTSIASLAAGSVATLSPGILSYEWDEDRDNGLRPPGLFWLSSTTIRADPNDPSSP